MTSLLCLEGILKVSKGKYSPSSGNLLSWFKRTKETNTRNILRKYHSLEWVGVTHKVFFCSVSHILLITDAFYKYGTSELVMRGRTAIIFHCLHCWLNMQRIFKKPLQSGSVWISQRIFKRSKITLEEKQS